MEMSASSKCTTAPKNGTTDNQTDQSSPSPRMASHWSDHDEIHEQEAEAEAMNIIHAAVDDDNGVRLMPALSSLLVDSDVEVESRRGPSNSNRYNYTIENHSCPVDDAPGQHNQLSPLSNTMRGFDSLSLAVLPLHNGFSNDERSNVDTTDAEFKDGLQETGNHTNCTTSTCFDTRTSPVPPGQANQAYYMLEDDDGGVPLYGTCDYLTSQAREQEEVIEDDHAFYESDKELDSFLEHSLASDYIDSSFHFNSTFGQDTFDTSDPAPALLASNLEEDEALFGNLEDVSMFHPSHLDYDIPSNLDGELLQLSTIYDEHYNNYHNDEDEYHDTFQEVDAEGNDGEEDDIFESMDEETDDMQIDESSHGPTPLPFAMQYPELAEISDHFMIPLEFIQSLNPAALAQFPDDFFVNFNYPVNPFVTDGDRSFCFAEFCKWLYINRKLRPRGQSNSPNRPRIGPAALEISSMERPKEISVEDVDEFGMDIQGIDWDRLEIERGKAREVRNGYYGTLGNYTNLIKAERTREILPKTKKYFSFRRTYTSFNIRHSHFQLRNLVCATSKNDVFYGQGMRVYRADPCSGKSELTMQFQKAHGALGDTVRITTLTAGNGVVIAGGHGGEYAMKSLNAPYTSSSTDGLVTDHDNGITNHIHMCESRTSGNPLAIFSSNDRRTRTLDCYRNQIIAEREFPWPVNCSATSPDSRLRVVVGDAKEIIIVDTNKGDVVHSLNGHDDFGFACAWSDDGYTVATGNQDCMVRIYDARNFSKVVTTLDAEVACVRSLRFSPLGSGPRVLVMSEPADMVSIVDAVSWDSQQHIDIFGEISGISFTPAGDELFIANADPHVGGLLQYERRNACVDVDASSHSSGDAYNASTGRRVSRLNMRSYRYL